MLFHRFDSLFHRIVRVRACKVITIAQTFACATRVFSRKRYQIWTSQCSKYVSVDPIEVDLFKHVQNQH